MTTIRNIFCKNLPVTFEGRSQVTIYEYDNDTFILRSFLPYVDQVTVEIQKPGVVLEDLEDGRNYYGVSTNSKTKLRLTVSPGVNNIFRIISDK
jgi:hypothetical protein